MPDIADDANDLTALTNQHRISKQRATSKTLIVGFLYLVSKSQQRTALTALKECGG